MALAPAAAPIAVREAAVARQQACVRAVNALVPTLVPLAMAVAGQVQGWADAAATAAATAAVRQILETPNSPEWWFSGHGFRVEVVGKGWFRVPPHGYGGPFARRGDLVREHQDTSSLL